MKRIEQDGSYYQLDKNGGHVRFDDGNGSRTGVTDTELIEILIDRAQIRFDRTGLMEDGAFVAGLKDVRNAFDQRNGDPATYPHDEVAGVDLFSIAPQDEKPVEEVKKEDQGNATVETLKETVDHLAENTEKKASGGEEIPAGGFMEDSAENKSEDLSFSNGKDEISNGDVMKVIDKEEGKSREEKAKASPSKSKDEKAKSVSGKKKNGK